MAYLHKMSWANEVVLEFLSLYKEEPSLWNPKDVNYCNRKEVFACWEKLSRALSIDASVAELKRKKESLMASYRCHKKKQKRCPKYRPSWFAFNLMDSFLGETSRYDATDCKNVEFLENEYYTTTDDQCDPIGIETEEEQADSDVKTIFPVTLKRPRLVKSLKNESRQINHEVANYYTKKRDDREMDDCDMYGQLLVSKLKKLSERQRDIAMHEIDNIMFRAKMNTLEVETSGDLASIAVVCSE